MTRPERSRPAGRKHNVPNIIPVNVQVFNGTLPDLFPSQVLVDGDRISLVGQPGESLPSVGCEVVDGGGATLMPGLINTHSHLTYINSDTVAGLTAIPVEEHVLVTAANAKLALDMGFTSVIGAASAKPRLDVVIRNAIRANQIPGPRIACRFARTHRDRRTCGR